MEYKLNIGDLRVSTTAVTYTCLGLGSCIGLFLQDRTTGISGGAHILLPTQVNPTDDGKYYDVKRAVEALMSRFRESGSNLTTLRAKITGGANVVATGIQTGKRNTENVIEQLLQHRVYIAALDVGGNQSRSARFESKSGTLTVRIPETNEFKVY